jgi:hypothetical protein
MESSIIAQKVGGSSPLLPLAASVPWPTGSRAGELGRFLPSGCACAPTGKLRTAAGRLAPA